MSKKTKSSKQYKDTYLKLLNSTVNEIIDSDETLTKNKKLIEAIETINIYKENGFLIAMNKKGAALKVAHNVSGTDIIVNTIHQLIDMLVKDENNSNQRLKAVSAILATAMSIGEEITNK